VAQLTQHISKLAVASAASSQLFWYTRGHQPVSFELAEILGHEEIFFIGPRCPFCEPGAELFSYCGNRDPRAVGKVFQPVAIRFLNLDFFAAFYFSPSALSIPGHSLLQGLMF
jgi:hypothetical protein